MTSYKMNLVMVSMLAIGCGNAPNSTHPPGSGRFEPVPEVVESPITNSPETLPAIDITMVEEIIIPLCNAKHNTAPSRENCLNDTIEQLLITFHRDDLLVPTEEE